MRFVCLALSLVLLLTACSGDGGANEPGDGGGPAALEQREDDLRETFEDAIHAFLDGDADAFYDHFSSDFQSRCDRNYFRGIVALTNLFVGDLSDREATIDITEVRFEDDRAFVEAKVDIEGAEIEGEDEEGSFADFWVLEDGEWKADTTEENPCEFGGGAFGDATPTAADDDDDPAGPGASRAEAVALGESVTTGDMRATALAVNFDAADELIAEDDFIDPPSAGNRYVLIDLRVEHTGEDEETLSVSGGDFELTGSRNLVYDNFDHGCGFYSGEIDGEMFPGGSLEGQVCFEVPQDESGLILIVAPFFSFDDEDKRYVALE